MSQDESAINNKQLSYMDLALFFIPLAASTMLIMTSHSIITSALARTAQAEIALAAYSVAQSIYVLTLSPILTLRRMAVALCHDQDSYHTVKKISFSTFSFVLALMALIAFTPVNRFVFQNLMGVKEQLLPETIYTFRFFLLIPIISMIRSIYQGVITKQRKTYLLTITVVIRLTVMVAVSSFLVKTSLVSGGAIGAVVLASGVATEGLLAWWTGRHLVKQLPTVSPQAKASPTIKMTWIYFLPLVAAHFVQTFGRPGLNAGLARTINPEVALASYQVARSFAWILIGMFPRVHQVVLVFVNDNISWAKTKRFVVVLGGLCTTALLMIALSPLGEWLIVRVIGVEKDLAANVLRAVAVMAFIPIVMALGELYTGLLMNQKRTVLVTIAKLINVSVLVTVVYLLINYFPHLNSLVGSLSMLSGYTVELGFVFWQSRDIVPKSKDTEIVSLDSEEHRLNFNQNL